MAKRQVQVEMLSFGRYTDWNPRSRDLPKVRKHTHQIPAEEGVEFGYVLSIRNARKCRLSFTIEHPPFLNDRNELAPPFEGEEIVPANRYTFFLGDAIWAPVEDKIGTWRLITRLDGNVVADEAFEILPPTDDDA